MSCGLVMQTRHSLHTRQKRNILCFNDSVLFLSSLLSFAKLFALFSRIFINKFTCLKTFNRIMEMLVKYGKNESDVLRSVQEYWL